MVEIEMQFIEFQKSSIWNKKFNDLRVDLENIKKAIREGSTRKKGRNRTTKDSECHSRNISFIENFATALLSIFSSTYAVNLYSQL